MKVHCTSNLRWQRQRDTCDGDLLAVPRKGMIVGGDDLLARIDLPGFPYLRSVRRQ